MPSGHVFIAMSLDGFVARKDHALDWLMKYQVEGEDQGYESFVADMDGLIMGSGSFKNVLSFGEWPYSKPVIVMSQSLDQEQIPEVLRDKVRLSRLTPVELMTSLDIEGWKRAYVDGGLLVQSFIRAGLVQELTITLIPILIGEGRPLFGAVDGDIELTLAGTTSFPSGFVQNRYIVKGVHHALF